MFDVHERPVTRSRCDNRLCGRVTDASVHGREFFGKGELEEIILIQACEVEVFPAATWNSF
jgi:hypothetical protein